MWLVRPWKFVLCWSGITDQDMLIGIEEISTHVGWMGFATEVANWDWGYMTASKKFGIFEDMRSKESMMNCFLPFKTGWVHAIYTTGSTMTLSSVSSVSLTLLSINSNLSSLSSLLPCTLCSVLSRLIRRITVTAGVNSEIADMLSVFVGMGFKRFRTVARFGMRSEWYSSKASRWENDLKFTWSCSWVWCQSFLRADTWLTFVVESGEW